MCLSIFVPIKPLWPEGAETLDIPFHFPVPIHLEFNWYSLRAFALLV